MGRCRTGGHLRVPSACPRTPETTHKKDMPLAETHICLAIENRNEVGQDGEVE
uniref:Uncharacterized protein n=1 Tax=Steinernema glaseri TaxID=37863 RepID=A0A1I8ATM0_9BILA